MNLLFIALGYLSKGELSIAAEFARQLPRDQFRVCFLTSRENQEYIEQFQLEAVTLQEHQSEANVACLDQLVRSLKPDYLIAADAYTLEHSAHWSGLNFQSLRKYDVPVVSFDEYEWPSTDYMVDFYGNVRRKFPPLIDECDYVIRNCPLNKPQTVASHIAQVSLYRQKWSAHHRTTDGVRAEKIIFIANSKWEYLNVSKLMSLGQLMVWMPRLLHDYLAALNQPLTIIHVGPVRWEFKTAEQITYRHVKGLPSHEFEECLSHADLFLTTNLASVTLSKAVFTGVPSILFHNPKLLDLNLLTRVGPELPDWFQDIVRQVKTVYPFKIFPWGWFDLLQPVIKDNPYMDCFAMAPLFERRKVLRTLEQLLCDPAAIAVLRERQEAYVSRMLQLPLPEEVFTSIFPSAERPGTGRRIREGELLF